MNVFISYSVDDAAVVKAIAAHLKPHAKLLYWDQSKQPGREAWPTIYSWINAADLVVVVLTGQTLARAISVGNEVGYARRAAKRIIPLVAPDVSKIDLGCLSGITYIALDYQNPYSTLDAVKAEVIKIATEKAEQAKVLAVLGLAVLAIVALSEGG